MSMQGIWSRMARRTLRRVEVHQRLLGYPGMGSDSGRLSGGTHNAMSAL